MGITSESGRYRVKVRSPHTVREYVVTADSRDAAWRYVETHAGDLTPEDTTEAEGVFWAAPDDRR